MNPSSKFNQSYKAIQLWLLGIILIFSGQTGLFAQDIEPMVASGDSFSAVIDDSGNLFTFGSNASGQLGVAEAGGSSAQVLLVEPAGAWAKVAVSRGAGDRAHVLAIQSSDGSLWAWGANNRGQLGIGSQIDAATPVLVDDSLQWAEVACGTSHSMALTTDGRIFLWGDNTFGQLGRPIADMGADGLGIPGSAENLELEPTTPLDSNTYLALAAGSTSNFAIRLEGGEQNLYSWGYTESAQLGILAGQFNFPASGPLTSPNRVGGRSDWTRVFAGSNISFGLAGDQLYVWGTGAGQNGLPFGSGFPNVPTKVNNDTDWADLSIGENHALGVKTNGDLYGWGINENGQLGLPRFDESGQVVFDNLNVNTPRLLEADLSFVAAGAGNEFSVVFSSSGFVRAAGIDNVGQLGDGTASLGIRDSFENTNLGAIDLVAASITVIGEATPGVPLQATFFLRNDGTGTIEDSFEIDAVISQNASFGGLGAQDLDFIVGGSSRETFPVTTSIEPGQGISLPVTIDLPGPINSGSYYLVFEADVERVLEEVSTVNNTVALEEGDRLDFTSDLQVASITVNADDPGTGTVESFPLAPGDPVQLEIEIANTGKGAIPAGTGFDLRLFFSPVQSTNGPGVIDWVSEMAVNGGIPSNDSVTLALTGPQALDLPLDLPPGNYFLGVEVDTNEVIAESAEGNNVGFSASPAIQIEGIELEEALDTVLFTTPIDFSFFNSGVPDGLPNWFGQSLVTSDGEDAAQSPPIRGGERATLVNENSTDSAVRVTFSWKAETSTAENFLFFGLNGVEVNSPVSRISGSTDWTEVSFVVPGNAQMTWTYVEGVNTENDAVYVDAISVTEISQPDLVIADVQGQAGDYVLLRDPMDLTIQLRNDGASTDLSTGLAFDLGIYLSADASFDSSIDRKVHTITRTDRISGGNNPLFIPSFDLPSDLVSGDYYLIAVVDESDLIDEGGSGGETNNVFVSAEPDVTIRALPDIEIKASDINAVPGYYLLGDELDFDFVYRNVGLSDITAPFRTDILFSGDNELGNDDDDFVASFQFNQGLPRGVNAPFDPDFVTVTPKVPLGRRSFFGVFVDVDGAIDESNESNNASVFPGSDFIFSEVSVAEAVGLSNDAQQDETAPFDGDLPWFGQSEVSFVDGLAAQSIAINDNETAAFQTEITTESDTFVTFHWKVSSELNEQTGKSDFLAFYVDDLNPDNYVRRIAGDVDWSRVSVFVEAGSHVLRWAYIKDSTVSAGADAGWVDNFSFETPDLVAENISIAQATLAPGDSINNFSFTISNSGASDVPASPPFDIRVILSKDATIGNDGDIEVGSIVETDGLASGESRQYGTAGRPLDFVVPSFIPESGDYFIGIIIDPGDTIPESTEANNSLLSSSASLAIEPAISLNEAIDDPNPGDVDAIELIVGGANGWFGVGNSQIQNGSSTSSDGVDAAQSAPIGVGESSFMQINVEDGPKILKFRWKVDSEPNTNQLEFSLNGVTKERISGQVDWDFSYGSFTLTLDGETTAPISSVQPQGVTLASAIENALNDLSAFSPGDGVSVAGGPTEFTITFIGDGNRPPLGFTSLNTNLVSSVDVTSVNGSSSTPEVQTLQIVPNVTFRLEYEGLLTDPIPYTASASDVKKALEELEGAGGIPIISDGVSVSGSNLAFEVTFNGPGERSEIGFLTSGLRRPVSLDTSVDVLGDATTNQIQSFSITPEVTIFVPAGPQELRWTYRKTTSGGEFADAGWVDDVRLDDFSGPELEVANVNYTPGEYVLEVGTIIGDGAAFLGTRFLDISVEAGNLGDLLPEFPVDTQLPISPSDPSNFSAADIEVRLSTDQVFGNADDIVLGSFAQAEGSLEPGQLLRFIGPLPLGDNIPAGFYYLMAEIDTLKRVADDEFTRDNNIWISDSRDVQITRLPRLEIVPDIGVSIQRNGIGKSGDFLDFDETLAIFGGDPYTFNLTVRNEGLGRVEGAEAFNTSVELIGILKEDVAGLFGGEEPPTLEDFQGLGSVFPLGGFEIKQLLRGRSFDEDTDISHPGDSVDLLVEGTFPTEQRLRNADIVDDEKPLSEYTFYIRFNLDSEDAIRESGEVNRWDSVDYSEFEASSSTNDNDTPDDPSDDFEEFSFLDSATDGAFEIRTLEFADPASWAAFHGVPVPSPLSGLDTDSDGINDFLEYAFNRNPKQNDGVGAFGSLAEVRFENEDYLSVVFDFLALSSDLLYVVEGSSDPAFDPASTVTLAIIDGPYTDNLGIRSLTGGGGLIDGGVLTLGDPTNANDFVLDVVDFGYTGRITVRDAVPFTDDMERFIRVTVSTTFASSAPIVAGAIMAASGEIGGEVDLPAPLSDADPLGGDWYASSWFGSFAYEPASVEPWVFSRDFGWVYVSPTGTDQGAWFYSSKLGTWMWGGPSLTRFFYNSSASQWMWVSSNPKASGAWLFYVDDSEWRFVKP
ncbi:MAG: hypothetical protein GVY36_07865 [Verrucomicrobia bacterium]|jgi:alpha-tubulin suppressor-like RCC1 family protein|nr:hypothetical protein [Verrucomicrobiota bacterium]